ncbi:MAG: DNA gyrase subunit A [Planctomycetes bacterium]|nr:DNA gyrase subunit A [Planctomycetota bacterium]
MVDSTPAPPDPDSPDLHRNLRDQRLDQEMKSSYLSYAMSVIIQRALPDVRDGLKPSQRRILVAMNDLNLGPRSKFRKCAKIVGDTTGNYHPHGDQAVYPTLVRLAQAFNMRYQLIDPQGNFGFVDGSPPAAMRYTEARMRAPATEIMADLEKETVDFVPNYDDTRVEPTVLPGRFPNLLCNGSQGIAVGMATSLPPHNLREVVDGIKAVIADPDIDLAALLQIIPGPDFPTGGIICGRSGIVRAYRDGRGQVTVRGRVHVEEKRGDRQSIVISELPYQVNPNTIFERLKDLINEGTIKSISNLNDETDRRAGMRLVIDLKKGESADVVINQLYKSTPLQSTFSIIMLALDKGRPRTFDLKGLLVAFKDHRVDVIQRRTRHLLRKAQERCHIVEGLRIAVQNIDEVVRCIKESSDPESARDTLMERFELSKRQADAILAMRLSRLTGLEVTKLEEEYQQLLADITRYKEILADISIVHQMILDELEETRAKFGDDRRTTIEDIETDIEDESLIVDQDVVVTVSHQGYIKRALVDTYRSQGRGGKGVTGADLKNDDFLERVVVSKTKDYFLIFTDRGRMHWLKVYQIPEASRQSRGRAIVNLLQLQEEEKISSIIPVREFDDDQFLVLCTARGYIKKTALSAFSNVRAAGIIACRLYEGDSLVRAVITQGQDELVIGTAFGQAVRFSETDVRPMGRTARGVRAVRFKKDDDRVIGLVVRRPDATLLTICENGYGKRTDFEEYRLQGRGGSGVRNIRTNERNGPVVTIGAVSEDEDLMLISERGMIVRIGTGDVSSMGRDTQGVRVMGLREGDRLIACARMAPEDEVEGAEEPEAVED